MTKKEKGVNRDFWKEKREIPDVNGNGEKRKGRAAKQMVWEEGGRPHQNPTREEGIRC